MKYGTTTTDYDYKYCIDKKVRKPPGEAAPRICMNCISQVS
jgi:hypothetical protein